MKSTQYPSRDDLIALLGAMSIFLSIIEHLLPKPLPFIRLGLANLPILLSLTLLRPKDIYILTLIKSLGSNLVTGTIFSWITLYSLSGSLFSVSIMILIYTISKRRVSMIGISVTGAFFSNTVQIILAYIILGRGVVYIGLPILITGLLSGIVLGLFTNSFITRSKWIRSLELKSL